MGKSYCCLSDRPAQSAALLRFICTSNQEWNAELAKSTAGIVGPTLIGGIKDKFGSFMAPMLILAVVNTCAVAYFAMLLLYLPVKPEDAREMVAVSEDEEDSAELVGGRDERTEQC